MHSSLLALWASWFLFASGQKQAQCQRGSTPGLSLLAHKSYVHKAIDVAAEIVAQFPTDIQFPSYASPWCPCGGYPEYCGLLQTEGERRLSRSAGRNYNKTLQCHQESCGEYYPTSAYSCIGAGGGGECLSTVGNCLYSTATTVNTTDGCGSRECFCAKVPPGQCIQENFPGYTIVQNGAYNLTTGKKWYPVGDGSTIEYPPDHRGWEPVGGPGNHACRGDNSSDNDPKHYEVHTIHSLSGCKDLCEGTDACTGIEYSAGRCEIWKRPRGIFAFKEIPLEIAEFTCLRYGWLTSKLVPVGPTGTSHPCRGRSSSDNHPGHYSVISGVTDIEECKAICAAWTGLPCHEYGCAPKCSGIEWSYGRCELW
eukprot:s1471_g11.t1